MVVLEGQDGSSVEEKTMNVVPCYLQNKSAFLEETLHGGDPTCYVSIETIIIIIIIIIGETR